MTEPTYSQTMGCICPHEEQSLGTLYGVRMGRGQVRTTTTKDCPVHDTCQRYTKAARAARPAWSNPYCPIHKTKDCPDG